MAPERSLPQFAKRTFRAEFEAIQHSRRDPARASGVRHGDPVLLFPDTFSNHFRPQSALAAVRVLEASGARVSLPHEQLCCGRAYYDFGMLDKAKSSLEKIVASLAHEIESGMPVVVLEPGCLSVFKDEMTKLLADNAGAAKLSKQAVSLGEVLEARGWKPKTSAAAPCCTATATRKPSAAPAPTSSSSKRPASKPKRPIWAVAAWPAPSVSGRRPTKPQSRSRTSRCCRK